MKSIILSFILFMSFSAFSCDESKILFSGVDIENNEKYELCDLGPRIRFLQRTMGFSRFFFSIWRYNASRRRKLFRYVNI